MRVRSIVAVLLLSSLTLGIGAREADDTPEACVKSFIDALNTRDLKAASNLLTGRKANLLMNLNQVIHGNSLYDVHSTKTYGAGDDVVVSAEIGISDQPKTNLHDLFHLVKTDGHWKIIPLDLAQMKTMPPSIVAAILSSDMTQQTRLAEKTTCLSNVKQLALGNLIYSNDYDDVMPRSDYWKSAITP